MTSEIYRQISEIQTLRRKADGVEIRYAEWNAGAEPTLLLLSPWPESLYAGSSSGHG